MLRIHDWLSSSQLLKSFKTNKSMEQLAAKRSKGGRPKKAVPRNQLLGVKCTLIERKAIEGKARLAGLTVSEYLRELGLKSKISGSNRAIPKEALILTGSINHVAANLNQIAHKRNKGEVLNALERAGDSGPC